MKLFKKAKKGFTLVELIVVIAIVAILAAVSVAGYYGFIESAKQSACDQEAAQVKLALQAACTPSHEGASYNYAFSNNGIRVSKDTTDPVKNNVITDFVAVLTDAGFDSAKYQLSIADADFVVTEHVGLLTKLTYTVKETTKYKLISFAA